MLNIRTKKDLRRIFRMSSDLSNLVEDMLERTEDYSPEFLSGLRRSVGEAALGKTRRIESLNDLR